MRAEALLRCFRRAPAPSFFSDIFTPEFVSRMQHARKARQKARAPVLLAAFYAAMRYARRAACYTPCHCCRYAALMMMLPRYAAALSSYVGYTPHILAYAFATLMPDRCRQQERLPCLPEPPHACATCSVCCADTRREAYGMRAATPLRLRLIATPAPRAPLCHDVITLRCYCCCRYMRAMRALREPPDICYA